MFTVEKDCSNLNEQSFTILQKTACTKKKTARTITSGLLGRRLLVSDERSFCTHLLLNTDPEAEVNREYHAGEKARKPGIDRGFETQGISGPTKSTHLLQHYTTVACCVVCSYSELFSTNPLLVALLVSYCSNE